MDLTKDEIESLLIFIELMFIPSVRSDADCDNMQYIANICSAWRKLSEMSNRMR